MLFSDWVLQVLTICGLQVFRKLPYFDDVIIQFYLNFLKFQKLGECCIPTHLSVTTSLEITLQLAMLDNAQRNRATMVLQILHYECQAKSG